MTYTIVGLGNPGDEYTHTRHNAGRLIALQFAKSLDIEEKDFKKDSVLFGYSAKGEYKKEKIHFILPETFMNNSGKSVKSLAGSAKKIERLVVINDDLDLGLGVVKMTFNRGSGGHRGVESIIRTLKSEAFIRIRIGISPTTPKGKVKKPSGEKKVSDFIIGEFKKKELEVLSVVGKKVVSGLKTLITDGREKAIQEMNTRG